MSTDWSFPPVPPDLKPLAPYFQRAQELRLKDPIIAYWCIYYAVQQGISSGSQSKDVRPFLFHALTILEQMKAQIGDNDAVSNDDAGAAYIENFALRVFTLADNEDRREQATRSTAKKFLASANFFELLKIFDKPVETDIKDKIRYAKWKAADLAKAFREGRKPIPGDAGAPAPPTPGLALHAPLEPDSDYPQPSTLNATSTGGSLEERTHHEYELNQSLPVSPSFDAHTTAPSMSAWSPGPSLAPSPAVRGERSLEASPTGHNNLLEVIGSGNKGSKSSSGKGKSPESSPGSTEGGRSIDVNSSEPNNNLNSSPILGQDVPLPPSIMGSTRALPSERNSSEECSVLGIPEGMLGSPQQALHSISSPEQVLANLPMVVTDAPRTPSPRGFNPYFSTQDAVTTPGMWSTVATPGIEDVVATGTWSTLETPGTDEGYRVGIIAESDDSSLGVTAGKLGGDRDVDEGGHGDDSWSTAGNMPMSRQNSWSVVDATPSTPPPSSDFGLGLEYDGIPHSLETVSSPAAPPHSVVKKVHFSPSVVGGLSSASSSVAGSSPPGSPMGYVPSLPTVQEAVYSSDSEREPTVLPLSSSAPVLGHGAPPVIQKVSSPNELAVSRSMPQVPPQFPTAPVPSQSPGVQDQRAAHFPTVQDQRSADFPSVLHQQHRLTDEVPSPQPPSLHTLHPISRFGGPSLRNNGRIPPSPPRSPTPPPDLTSAQVTRIQKHCRFAISALDFEDSETARRELRAALAMLGG